MKLLKRKDQDRNKPSSAWARARRRLEADAARESSRPARLSHEETSTAPEIFVSSHVCSGTGKPFSIVWQRTDRASSFAVHEIIKGEDKRAEGSTKTEPQRTQDVIPTAQFDCANRVCPWCDWSGAFLHCSCGLSPCMRGEYTRGGERRLAVAGCCDSGVADTSATTFRGQAQQAPQERRQLTGKQRPLLAAPRPQLSWKK